MSLSANNVSYRVDENTELVSKVSLNLEAGKVSAVIGPNGAGKSTLLKMLSGELRPSSGTIDFEDQNIESIEHLNRAQKIGVLPQSSDVNFQFLVYDIVMLGRLPHARNSSAEVDRKIVWKCMEMTETVRLASRKFPTLSGGEKQRVQLARVLAQLHDTEEDSFDHKVLLLDEPTSALDLSHQHRMLQIARDVAKRNAAVLIVLHDLNLAAQYSDQIHLLCCGELIEQGSPREVLKPELIQRIYGVQAMIQDHPDGDFPIITTLSSHSKKKSESQSQLYPHWHRN